MDNPRELTEPITTNHNAIQNGMSPSGSADNVPIASPSPQKPIKIMRTDGSPT